MSQPRASAAAVRLRGVRRAYEGRQVLDGIDLDVAAGEFVALIGPSGSGKSTLVRIIAGLDQDAEGEIQTVDRRTVVFQEPRLLPWKRVWRNVMIGLGGPDRRSRAAAALDEVGVADRIDAWPLTLSGGEAQRVALARALVRRPQLLLADEPFASVDALTRLRVQRLVARLWAEHGLAVLLVTHDVTEALLLADRVLVLSHGRLVDDLPVPLERPRDIDTPHFAELRRRLLVRLGVEPEAPAPPPAQPDPPALPDPDPTRRP